MLATSECGSHAFYIVGRRVPLMGSSLNSWVAGPLTHYGSQLVANGACFARRTLAESFTPSIDLDIFYSQAVSMEAPGTTMGLRPLPFFHMPFGITGPAPADLAPAPRPRVLRRSRARIPQVRPSNVSRTGANAHKSLR